MPPFDLRWAKKKSVQLRSSDASSLLKAHLGVLSERLHVGIRAREGLSELFVAERVKKKGQHSSRTS